MYQKCKVVCLPTNQEATNGLQPIASYAKPDNKGNLFMPITGSHARRLQQMGHQAYHLYILSDDEIQVGDWSFCPTQKDPFILCVERPFCSPSWLNSDDCKDVKKIIASTDPTLNLPSPSPEFIQVYCQKQPKEVMVKYVLQHDLRTQDRSKEFCYIPVVSNNQISIRRIKQSYTRQEFQSAIAECVFRGMKHKDSSLERYEKLVKELEQKLL